MRSHFGTDRAGAGVDLNGDDRAAQVVHHLEAAVLDQRLSRPVDVQHAQRVLHTPAVHRAGVIDLQPQVAAGTDCDPGRPGPRGHELPRLARLPVERDDAIGPITANQAVSGTVRKRPARIAESTCMHVLVPYLSHVSSALHLDAFAFIPCPVLNSAPVGCHARALRRGFALENSNSGHGTWTGTQD